MARLVICPECGVKNDKDATVFHSKRYYCVECYDALMRRKKEREFLISYINSLYGLNPNNKFDGRLAKDLKNLNEEGYSYRDVYLTLLYCKEVERMHFNVQYGLGCVRFYKFKALEYFKKQSEKNNINKKAQKLEAKIVSITYKQGGLASSKRRKIDIGEL